MPDANSYARYERQGPGQHCWARRSAARGRSECGQLGRGHRHLRAALELGAHYSLRDLAKLFWAAFADSEMRGDPNLPSSRSRGGENSPVYPTAAGARLSTYGVSGLRPKKSSGVCAGLRCGICASWMLGNRPLKVLGPPPGAYWDLDLLILQYRRRGVRGWVPLCAWPAFTTATTGDA